MAERIVGEFSPPRELVVVAAARASGKGLVTVGDTGLVVEATILGVSPPIPPWASLVVVLVGMIVWLVVPSSAAVLTPATTFIVLVILWLRYRAEFGLSGAYTVPWSAVQHVVRLPSNPDVVAIVFHRPLAGRGTPEQVYFAPTVGVEALVAALREHAPREVTWDLESAVAARSDDETDPDHEPAGA